MELNFKFNTLTVLLGINVVVFLLALLFTASLGFDANVFYLFGGLIPERVLRGDFWLLLTSAFFHLEVLHFLFNIYGLLRIGQVVSSYYGGKILLITYVFGALGGSILSVFLGSGTLSLGASGAIFALVGLLLGGTLKKYRFGRELPFSIWDILPIVLISFWIGLTPGSRINNWAHLGGLLAGVILGLILKHAYSGYLSNTDKNIEKVLYYFSLIFFVASFVALLINAGNLIFLD